MVVNKKTNESRKIIGRKLLIEAIREIAKKDLEAIAFHPTLISSQDCIPLPIIDHYVRGMSLEPNKEKHLYDCAYCKARLSAASKYCAE